MHGPLTPEQVRAGWAREGKTLASFCRQHGLNKNLVSDLLNGRKKGCYGEAHRAAVLLGIKEGVVNDSSPIVKDEQEDETPHS